MKSIFYIVFFSSICINVHFGQIIPIVQSPDSTAIDTIPNAIDSTILQPEAPPFDTITIRFSKDSIDSEVLYFARDSSDLRVQSKKLYLYGEARVKYKELELTADYIEIDIEKNLAIAKSIHDDPAHRGFVTFKGEGEEVQADAIEYNFKTKKGLSVLTRSKFTDLYATSTKSKFVSREDDDDVIYGTDAIFSTCDAPEPHFGIRTKKQKIVPDKVVVIGPSNLEIMNVPTPLVMPFGFFPLKQGARKGIIFPSDYDFSPALGFGLRGIGYYFPINDRMDLTLTGDLYLRGSFNVYASSRYLKRYKYNGNLTLTYSRQLLEEQETGLYAPNISGGIRWQHSQDAKSNPNQTLSASVNIQTNKNQSTIYNDAASVLTNTLNSNVSYSRRFPGRPYSLAASFGHSQNTQTRRMDITFPVVDFQVQRLYPFKRKSASSPKPRWYEEISFQYSSKLSNRFTTTDTTLFTKMTLDSAQFGIQHRTNVNTTFKLLKYLTFIPGVDYTETWQFKTIDKVFDPTFIITPRDTMVVDSQIFVRYDTIPGRIVTSQIPGFRAWRTVTVSGSVNTQIFGTVNFKKGIVKGLRHVMKPSVSFIYSPNYQNPNLDYYRRIQRDINAIDSVFFSVFEGGIFGTPPQSGKQLGFNYSLNNIFEAKYRLRSDTADRKFRLFDNINLSGNYNAAADSLKFSQVNISGVHRMFKGMTTLQANLALDPYMRDDMNRRINVFAWNAERKLLKLVNFNATLSTALALRTVREWLEGKDEAGSSQQPSNPELGPQSLWDVFDNFTISHTLMVGVAKIGDRDTFMIGTNNIQFNGNLPITKNWRITLGSIGYDFNRKQLTYPDVGFFRELHCWEMGMTWQPLRGTYNFYIRVKPSSMDFLKVPYRRNNIDGPQRL
ncbi:MAG: LPS-assembly protein LptD [Saprospiraceae bacterium]|nr:LPS-assembly protein LptD [Saprospiraceae bacterium]